MKALLLFFMILLFCLPAQGAVGNSDLVINGGIEELTLKEGEKIRLRAKDDLTRFPILKGLYFQSSNPAVASVEKRSGILRGHIPGKATIFITSSDGDNASVQVTVEAADHKKASPLFLFFLLIITAGTGLIWIRG